MEAFVYSKGSYAYGGYPDIDELFQQQARERDPAKREVLLHRIQQLTIDRVMFAPIWNRVAHPDVNPFEERSPEITSRVEIDVRGKAASFMIAG